jgi:hypothetical protein
MHHSVVSLRGGGCRRDIHRRQRIEREAIRRTASLTVKRKGKWCPGAGSNHPLRPSGYVGTSLRVEKFVENGGSEIEWCAIQNKTTNSYVIDITI